VAKFETQFTTVTLKLTNITTTNDNWQQGVQKAFDVHKLKAYLLLKKLPSSLDTVVETLQSKTSLTNAEVRTRILELSSDASSAGGSALMSHSSHKKKQKKKVDSRPSTSSGS